MKKRISALLLVLCLFVLLPQGGRAAEYPCVYDASGLLDTSSVAFLEDMTVRIAADWGVEVRVDVVQDLAGYTIEEYAALFYSSYGYGFANGFQSESGLLLMVCLPAAEGGGVSYGGSHIMAGGLASQVFDEAQIADMNLLLEMLLCESAFGGDSAADAAALNSALMSFYTTAEGIMLATGESLQQLQLPTVYVDDRAYLLDEQDIAEFNDWGLRLASQYGCGVYMVTLPDMASLGFDDPFYCAIDIYEQQQLGVGAEQNGILLLLSMAERDYAIAVYGDSASEAFTDYGTALLADDFLDDFADDYWYGGFYDYYDYCEYLLEMHAAGTPVDFTGDDDRYHEDGSYDHGYYEDEGLGGEGIGVLIGMFVGVPCIVALVVCLIFRAQLKSTRRQVSAERYVAAGGVHITQRWDHFTHRTETRHKIESSSSSSGGGSSRSSSSSSRSSGGFSGRSGKF
ncbi:MAG: TPM domain-containing protein [Oscillospiraceae bacterium]|nr:TPM domain-containing protein [Oscillospiraceae bacterium]